MLVHRDGHILEYIGRDFRSLREHIKQLNQLLFSFQFIQLRYIDI